MIRHLLNPKWPFRPARWPFFYGWMIVVSGTLGIIMSIPGQTMGVSTFTDSLILSVEISRGQLSTAYLLGTIASSFLLTQVGKAYDRYGARPIALAATSLMAIVLIYLSQVDYLITSLFGESPSSLIKITFMFLGFFVLRFSGQGALTLVSRNMMMKWFEERRGFAIGFSNVATSMGFASAPLFFEFLIQRYEWQGAWLILATLVGIGFGIYILTFYRDSPETCGLKADGGVKIVKKEKKNSFPVIRDFTLSEARRTVGFWIFTFMLCGQAMYITGLTFHITSIFETAGYQRADAISIFLPSSVVAVVVTLSTSSLSDHIRLKNLLYVMGIGALIALLGMIGLSYSAFAKWALIMGNGIMMGLYSVVLSVCWPRYYGKTHLGAISGHAITYIVIASAIGPKLFSWSLDTVGDYSWAGWTSIAIFGVLLILSHWANNPQEKLRETGLT